MIAPGTRKASPGIAKDFCGRSARCSRAIRQEHLLQHDERHLHHHAHRVPDEGAHENDEEGAHAGIVPEASAWARSFSSGLRVSPRTFRTQTAPHILNIAVEGIAVACAPDVEQRLVDLLGATIDECQAMILADAALKRRAVAELTSPRPEPTAR